MQLGLEHLGAVLQKRFRLQYGSFGSQIKSKFSHGELAMRFLPIAMNLTKRRVIHDDKCSICTIEPESTIQALWDCVTAQDIWDGSVRKL